MRFSFNEAYEAVKDFLSKNSLEDFSKHGIKAKSDGNHIILDYDMIDVKWDEPYGWICRGLVLDAKTYEVLGFGLHKFFNIGEGHAHQLDWNTVRIYEKLDGSMVKRWWSPHTGKFEYSTRRQLPGDLKANRPMGSDMTWEDMILRCLKDVLPDVDQAKDETLVFEIMSPLNRVVVPHKDFSAKLLARRNNRTFEEVPIHEHPHAPKTFSFASAEEMAEFANTLSGLEAEGFVGVDGAFGRAKCKGRDYQALHHMKDSAGNSLKSIIMVVRRGEWSEVATAFPEFIPAIEAVSDLVEKWKKVHEDAWEELREIKDRKEFALAVQAKKLPQPGFMFSLFTEHVKSVKEAIESMDDNRYLRNIKPLAEKAGITVYSLED